MKNKLRIGLKEYFRPTPERVKRFLLMLKGIIATSAFVAYENSGWQGACIVGIAGFLINEAFEFVSEHPDFLAVDEAKAALKDKVEEVAEEVKHDLETKEEDDTISTQI